ncbi:MAG: hypothetical protein E7239_12250 [Sarcina sp.]|nr:hypothetical protein [Sarcina sp.]
MLVWEALIYRRLEGYTRPESIQKCNYRTECAYGKFPNYHRIFPIVHEIADRYNSLQIRQRIIRGGSLCDHSAEGEKDLFMENEAMHNCVRIYSPSVVRGSCKIYFLHRKEKPGTSYGTIEVWGNTLVQAKGFANSRLEQPAQDFIRKWCTAKHLDIRIRDISDV